jgi:uncharacterized membrane protein YheB (UPF0754 family)
MKLNLKIQQHIQIIDKNIEKSMVKNNIKYITKNYQEILNKYQNVNFSKNIDKVIIYKDIEQVSNELQTYFSIS